MCNANPSSRWSSTFTIDNDVWTYLCWRLKSVCIMKEKSIRRVKLVYNSDLSISRTICKSKLNMLSIRSQVQLKEISKILGATFGISVKKRLLKKIQRRRNRELI